MAQRIMRRLGLEAEAIIRRDPYVLAFKVEGVGFKSADRAAKALGWPENSPERLEAAVLVALAEGAMRGHVFSPSEELVKEASQFAPTVAKTEIAAALSRATLAGRVVPLKRSEPGGQDVYAPRLFRAETWAARALLAIKDAPRGIAVPQPEKALAWAEKGLGFALDEGQRAAALAAVSQKAVVITGGPGTGKTTIAQAICRIWREVSNKFALCAPTGRAAKRLSQATGLEATTIHRLLEYSPQAGGFARGPKNRLDLDMLLVDEASMLDVLMANQLFGALPAAANLILIGDGDQLPPVGPGWVLGDLMAARVFPTHRLSTIYRQGELSLIPEAARLINLGLTPDGLPKGPDVDFHFVEESDPLKIRDKILRLTVERAPLKFGLNPKTDIQILCPIHRGDLGTMALNDLLGQRLNPLPGPALTRFDLSFRVGDRVIQNRNNYQKGVYNGDLGFVAGVDLEGQELGVEFDQGRVVYQISELDDLRPAWALTVHKAQGSEFPAVIMPLYMGHCRALRRKLLYTAVTRGRRLVVLVGSKSALAQGVSDSGESQRRSNLANFLRHGPPPLNYAQGFLETQGDELDSYLGFS
jgi:exodeoxyribonuclease V alpha subunit